MNGSAESTDERPAVVVLETLKKRSDFLACARARKAPAPGFLLQGRKRSDATDAIRIGYTASKKIGNAVARNRAKRRLRAMARNVLTSQGKPGWDYVLVARPAETNTRSFADLSEDLTRALAKLHAPRDRSSSSR